MANRRGKSGSRDRFPLLGSEINVDGDCSMKLEDDCFLQESYDKLRQYVKKQRHHFADKGPYSQDYGLSSSHVRLWELDYEEGRAQKNGCFWTVMLKKTLESPLDSPSKSQSPLTDSPGTPHPCTPAVDSHASPLWWVHVDEHTLQYTFHTPQNTDHLSVCPQTREPFLRPYTQSLTCRASFSLVEIRPQIWRCLR